MRLKNRGPLIWSKVAALNLGDVAVSVESMGQGLGIGFGIWVSCLRAFWQRILQFKAYDLWA